ncbi:MmgE/PrpD family protein [Mesorhizobium sp. M0870]|uniref:MmgE/PrpD family protein n=1 Tax=Mesorhizobium sp. M0870 TaxID=2957016 RepID=UPI0033382876
MKEDNQQPLTSPHQRISFVIKNRGRNGKRRLLGTVVGPVGDQLTPTRPQFHHGRGTSVDGGSNAATKVLASYVAGLRFDDLPAAVVDATKLLILDNVGCALAGSQTMMAPDSSIISRRSLANMQ